MNASAATLDHRGDIVTSLPNMPTRQSRAYSNPSDSGEYVAFVTEGTKTGSELLQVRESKLKSLWMRGDQPRPFSEVDCAPELFLEQIENGTATFEKPDFLFLLDRAASKSRESLPAIRLLGAIAESYSEWRPEIAGTLRFLLSNAIPEVRAEAAMAALYIYDPALLPMIQSALESETNTAVRSVLSHVISKLS